MGRCVIKLGDKFCEWTSVSDGPASLLLSEEMFKRYWREEYGRNRLHELPQLLMDAKKYGTSARMHDSVDGIIRNNRAGEKGQKLTKKQIIDQYSIETEEDFLEWSKNREVYAQKQVAEWQKIAEDRAEKSQA